MSFSELKWEASKPISEGEKLSKNISIISLSSGCKRKEKDESDDEESATM